MVNLEFGSQPVARTCWRHLGSQHGGFGCIYCGCPYLITTTWGSGHKMAVSSPGSGGQKFQNQCVGGGGGGVGLPVKYQWEGPFLISGGGCTFQGWRAGGQVPLNCHLFLGFSVCVSLAQSPSPSWYKDSSHRWSVSVCVCVCERESV